jgi:hypothetical protein
MLQKVIACLGGNLDIGAFGNNIVVFLYHSVSFTE